MIMNPAGELSILDPTGKPYPASALYAGEFEGAATGRRMGGWGLSSSGPNTALLNSMTSLRSRQRELVRNHALAGGGVDSIVANMIGTGIKPRWNMADSEINQRLQELWADSIPEMDADETCSFYGLQDVVARTMCNGGEALAQFHHVSPRLGLAVPLQLRVIEGDFLDESYSTIADNGNEVRMGVEFDRASGRRVAYYLWKNHPGEAFLNTDTTTRIRVPASEIMHVFRPLRAGQLRGLPWFSRIIVKLHEIDQCVDAELVRRKTTAMFGGFITEMNPMPVVGNPLGRPMPGDENNNMIIALEPGTFPKLPPGTDVKFSQPTDVSGNYVAWMQQQLRDVAVGMGITYEQLTGDLHGVTYSSIRAGLIEFRRIITQIQAITIVFQFCRKVMARWMDTAVFSGAIVLPDYTRNRRRYQRVQWMPDGWDWVDPLKDLQADIMEIRSGMTSRQRKVAERIGVDAEIIDREILEDNKRQDEFGLVLDSDPRKTTGSGLYQGDKSNAE